MVVSTDPSLLTSQPPGSPDAVGIGIVGGGQLALMLAEAARQQCIALHLQTPGAADPAVGQASSVLQAQIGDASATLELSRRCGAISFENEWVDLDALAPLAAAGVVFLPSLESLRPLVDKRQQRELLGRLSIPTPRWLPLDTLKFAARVQPHSGVEQVPNPDVAANFFDSAVPWQLANHAPAIAAGASAPEPSDLIFQTAGADGAGLGEGGLPQGWSFPVVAKAIRGGYDGKGTLILRSTAELARLLKQVDPALWILEEFVAFERELALVACRDRAGSVACYPLVETHQHHQVCDWVVVPAKASHSLEAMARNMAASLLTALDYVGVLSIELFYGPAGLLINELAPRTHNSGHYSIEACSISQFAQQVRIVAGHSLQAPELTAAGALMVNLLGNDRPEAEQAAALATLAALPNATLHWYRKQGTALGRKMGHITVVLQAPDPEDRAREAQQRLEDIRTIWPQPNQEWA